MSDPSLQSDFSTARWESIRAMVQQTNLKQSREQAHLARMRAQEEAKALRKVRHEAKMAAQDQQKSRRKALHLARMYHQEHRPLPPSLQELVRSAKASASGTVSGSTLSSRTRSQPSHSVGTSKGSTSATAQRSQTPEIKVKREEDDD